jgi:hypothetical protein
MKDQRKINIKARGSHVNTNKEKPLNIEKAKDVKRGGEKLRIQKGFNVCMC